MSMVSPAPFPSTLWLLKAVDTLFYPGDYSVLQFFRRMGGENTLGDFPGRME